MNSLTPRHYAFIGATDAFRQHAETYKEMYEAEFGKSVEHPVEDFGMLPYGTGHDVRNAIECRILGAGLVEISTVDLTRGRSAEENLAWANLSDFNFLRMYVYLYDELGAPLALEGDSNVSVGGCKKNDYSIAFGRECLPFAVQTGLLGFDYGRFAPEQLESVPKHELTDEDCINLLALYASYVNRLFLHEDFSLSVSDVSKTTSN